MNRFDRYTDAAELKKAYRAESQRCHPDHNGGDTTMFVRMRAEYEERLAQLLREANHQHNHQKARRIIEIAVELINELYPKGVDTMREMAKMPLFVYVLDMLKARLGASVGYLLDQILKKESQPQG